MLRGFLNQAFDIATRHDRDNNVGLSFVVTQIMDSDYVRVVTESPHRPGFAADAGSGGIIQLLGLDEGKGHITVKERIMGEVDLLLATLPEELLHLITAIDKGSGHGRRWGCCRSQLG